MKRRVLLLDDRSDSLEERRRLLEEGFDVHAALNVREALQLCEEESPFAVFLTTDRSIRDQGEAALLRFRKHWPDTARILLVESTDLEHVVRAMQEGSFFRILQEPVQHKELLAVVEAGVAQYRRIEKERLFTEQLQFCRESLLELTETLERRLEDQIERMHLLQRFSSELTETGSLEEIAELAAIACSRLIGSRAVSVLLEDASQGRQVEGKAGGPLSFRVHSEPVQAAEGEIGLVQIDEQAPDGRTLSPTELDALRSLACSTANAAFNHIHRSAREVAHHAAIHALSRLAENRDDETAKHLERVSEYCRVIAQGLREDGHYVETLGDEYVHDLTLSAPLHDIGKVGIPDSILLKPGPLNEEEWAVMKKHPTIGAETIHHVLERTGEQSFLRMGLEIAWCHHERWDGSGYPRGLTGEEIPLSARIMALADVYDALTTWRPYKRPWTHVEALTYVLEERGGHFDPKIVDCFAKRSDRFDTIRAELADSAEDVETISAA